MALHVFRPVSLSVEIEAIDGDGPDVLGLSLKEVIALFDSAESLKGADVPVRGGIASVGWRLADGVTRLVVEVMVVSGQSLDAKLASLHEMLAPVGFAVSDVLRQREGNLKPCSPSAST